MVRNLVGGGRNLREKNACTTSTPEKSTIYKRINCVNGLVWLVCMLSDRSCDPPLVMVTSSSSTPRYNLIPSRI